MITGIGTDIIEIRRIRNARMKFKNFLSKIFTADELIYCLDNAGLDERLAGRFAAKEAIAKALGSSQSWLDVEILSDELGKPIVNLKGKAAIQASGSKVHVSISHCKEYATAVAVIEKIESGD